MRDCGLSKLRMLDASVAHAIPGTCLISHKHLVLMTLLVVLTTCSPEPDVRSPMMRMGNCREGEAMEIGGLICGMGGKPSPSLTLHPPPGNEDVTQPATVRIITANAIANAELCSNPCL
jgi:hypothetical protein